MILSLGLLIITLTTACATPTPVIQTVEVTRLVPQVVIATLIIRETVVSSPESTVPSPSTVQITSTPTPTPTPTVTLESRFPNAKLTAFGFRDDGKFFVTIDTGQTLTGQYIARLDKLDYDCVVPAKYPERLYCYGILERPGKIVEFQVFTVAADASRAIVFDTVFSAPLVPTVTPTSTITPTPTVTP